MNCFLQEISVERTGPVRMREKSRMTSDGAKAALLPQRQWGAGGEAGYGIKPSIHVSATPAWRKSWTERKPPGMGWDVTAAVCFSDSPEFSFSGGLWMTGLAALGSVCRTCGDRQWSANCSRLSAVHAVARPQRRWHEFETSDDIRERPAPKCGQGPRGTGAVVESQITQWTTTKSLEDLTMASMFQSPANSMARPAGRAEM